MSTYLKGATGFATAVVYLSGFLQGLTLVSIPASSVVLKHAHNLSGPEYGFLFLPQVAFTVLGSVLGGAFSKRFGLKSILLAALLCNAFSQAALAESAYLSSEEAYYMLLLSEMLLGLGFGLAAAPLNSFPQIFFPLRRDTAVVVLHTLLAGGLAAGPVIGNLFIGSGAWAGFPITLAALSLSIAAAAMVARMSRPHEQPESEPKPSEPISSTLLWLFITISVLYAFAEGTFSNWTMIYLHETKSLPEAAGALALSLFWAFLAAGRLLVSVLVLLIPSVRIWQALPVFMASVFLLLPYADSALLGAVLFSLAGLSCSAFFPLTVRLASKRFPAHIALVSSIVTASLMIGVGSGTFATGLLAERLPLEVIYKASAFYPLSAFFIITFLMRRL